MNVVTGKKDLGLLEPICSTLENIVMSYIAFLLGIAHALGHTIVLSVARIF